jgi:hypothetical protein
MPLAPIILQLIAQFGVPLAAQIYGIVTKHFEANQKPTPEMWQALIDAENASHAAFAAALRPPTP